MLTEQQYQERQSGIGGSDAAVVCGLSPWKTPLELYLEKRGEIPRNDRETEAMKWGTILESVVAKEFSERHGLKVRQTRTRWSKVHPFMCVNMDRAIDKTDEHGTGYLECKTSNAFKASDWGKDPSGPVPDYYYIQLQHGLAVTGYSWGALAVLIGGNTYRDYFFERDNILISNLIQIERNFWVNHVDAGIPPEPDFDHKTTSALLDVLYPSPDGIIDLPPGVAQWAAVEQSAAEQIKMYAAVREGAQNHIKDIMGDAGVGRLPGGGGYVRKKVKRKGYVVENTEYLDFRFKKKL